MMRSVVSAIVLSLAIGVAAVPSYAQESPAADEVAQLSAARERLDRGDVDGADRAFAQLTSSASLRVAGQAWFFRGVIAERRLAFAEAVAEYTQSVARDPGGRYAARASARIEYLRAHAEGNFVPLQQLERIRGDTTRASDPTAIAELARAAETFPPGPVRAEARLLVAQAYVGRLHRPADAAPVLAALARDPSTAPDLRRIATEMLARVREERGEFAIALRELTDLHAPEPVVTRVRRRLRRAWMYRAAWVSIALVALAGVVSILRIARRKRLGELIAAWRRPLPLAHLAMLSLGGALLAHSYEEHDMRPFFGFGAGALFVYFAATAWSLAGSTHPLARTGRAIACALAVLSVSFLAMHRFDVGMLEGINL
jgi:hypothetical protein